MKKLFRGAVLGVVLLAGVGSLRADDALRRVQQSLRDQGFYYGPVDGSPGDETNQAVRRYQIRNGLPVTGQLDDETRRSISKNGGEVAPDNPGGTTTRPTVRPIPSAASPGSTGPSNRNTITGDGATPSPNYQRPSVRPAPEEALRDTPRPQAGLGDDQGPSPRGGGRYDRSGAPGNYSRPDLRAAPDEDDESRPAGGPGGPLPRNAVLPSARLSALFASTPFEFAPPPVQADVLRRAQRLLTQSGFYDGPVNGVPSPLVADALLNYQGVRRLRKTGRLDVSTLGNMRLLPGRQSVLPRGRDEDDDDRRGGPDIIFEGRIAH